MAVKILSRKVPDLKHDIDFLHPILQKIFLSRGVTTSKELDQELQNLLPFDLLTNIDRATSLIYKHINLKNKILIIGDFDGDGATSTALAVSFFRELGVEVDYLVPNRFEYGYGLSVELVIEAKKRNPALLITVDSGIACIPGVKQAKDFGLDVLVTDHHLPGDNLPVADCIVNPNLKDDKFPSKTLAGVGVIFYVLLALRAKLKQENWFERNNKPIINMAQFLDLVALGTITDVVPLDYNNRVLVANGLKRIQSGVCRVGIKALLKISKKNYKNVTSTDLGFSVGPRLNAAGRLDDMSLGIECLLCQDPMSAFRIAENLDALNYERKAIEKDMKLEALCIINNLNFDDTNLPLAFCLYQDSWHQGVIGIVAARIKELYHRPVIVFAEDNEEYIKGSCRSIEGVHMRDVLQNIATKYPKLINKFGGHAMAAGLSIKKSDYERFNQEFLSEISNHLSHDNIYGRCETDGQLDYHDIHLDLAKLIQQYGPWGQHFPEPTFSGDFIVLEKRLLGNSHYAFKLRPDINNYIGGAIEGIIFNCQEAHWFEQNLFKVRLVYKLAINEFNNNIKLQLLVDYLEPI